MDKEIWVYAELADGKPAPVFYELIAKADEIASTKGWNTAAVILGSNLVSRQSGEPAAVPPAAPRQRPDG